MMSPKSDTLLVCQCTLVTVTIFKRLAASYRGRYSSGFNKFNRPMWGLLQHPFQI